MSQPILVISSSRTYIFVYQLPMQPSCDGNESSLKMVKIPYTSCDGNDYSFGKRDMFAAAMQVVSPLFWKHYYGMNTEKE